MKRLQSTAKSEYKTSKKKSDSDNTNDEKIKDKSSSAKSATDQSVSHGGKFSFLSLKDSMNDKTLQVMKNERFICIRDKYPKSRIHLLLIPLGVQLLKVQDIIKLPNAIEILKEMKQLTGKIVEENFPKDCKSKVLMGFHAIQSMNPLHMHILTADFKSDCLKNKKHWNSFNSSYFFKLDDLLQKLEEENNYFAKDKFNLNNGNVLKEFLNSELRCNVCKIILNNMPNLKKHLLTHS